VGTNTKSLFPGINRNRNNPIIANNVHAMPTDEMYHDDTNLPIDNTEFLIPAPAVDNRLVRIKKLTVLFSFPRGWPGIGDSTH